GIQRMPRSAGWGCGAQSAMRDEIGMVRCKILLYRRQVEDTGTASIILFAPQHTECHRQLRDRIKKPDEMKLADIPSDGRKQATVCEAV
ncbi:hypothetical protein, partial [Burkholderia pseudomallei]|uniref:hypothetical protein n=1 Tax=Burkholderia pseudomallei TaxID=28450 RepID=UPI00351C1343